jgi:GTP cyclohydrolase IA
MPFDESAHGRHVRDLLAHLGDDPDRPGLDRTPARMLESLQYLTRGQRERLEDVVEDGCFEEPSHDLVLVRHMEFVSLCEHHVLPFYGHAHVGYVPDGRILGLSKIARIVDHFACRLQVQERLTAQIADALMDVLRPRGLGVVMSATHLCMVARGVRKQDSDVLTSAWRGSFADNDPARDELLRGVGRP